MKIIEKEFKLSGSKEIINVYPIGDLHIGKNNCAEKSFEKLVDRIANDANGYWVGGGDLCDCISPQDVKRWDAATIPDWLLEGSPDVIRLRMEGVVECQVERLLKMIDPIKGKCLGLVEGNHEYSIKKYHNYNVQGEICKALGTVDLTDCCFLRLKCSRSGGVARRVVDIFITHGHGGGRTMGAEPNHLYRLVADKDCDIVMRGHSHTYCQLPPIPRLFVPDFREKTEKRDCKQRIIRAFNWGCYVLSYASGPSTYESRSTYPARPLTTAMATIRPFDNDTYSAIDINEINLSW